MNNEKRIRTSVLKENNGGGDIQTCNPKLKGKQKNKKKGKRKRV